MFNIKPRRKALFVVRLLILSRFIAGNPQDLNTVILRFLVKFLNVLGCFTGRRRRSYLQLRREILTGFAPTCREVEQQRLKHRIYFSVFLVQTKYLFLQLVEIHIALAAFHNHVFKEVLAGRIVSKAS